MLELRRRGGRRGRVGREEAGGEEWGGEAGGEEWGEKVLQHLFSSVISRFSEAIKPKERFI